MLMDPPAVDPSHHNERPDEMAGDYTILTGEWITPTSRGVKAYPINNISRLFNSLFRPTTNKTSKLHITRSF